MRLGSWRAFRSTREPNVGSVIGYNETMPLSRFGKRKIEALGEGHACLMLRSYAGAKRRRARGDLAGLVAAIDRGMERLLRAMYDSGAAYEYGATRLPLGRPPDYTRARRDSTVQLLRDRMADPDCAYPSDMYNGAFG